MRNVCPLSLPTFPTLLGVALLAAMSWPSAAHAATRTVANCNDSGTGSLRSAVASAMSGDTIDLKSLTCSRILLASQINIPQADLTLIGPGRFALTLDGNHASRVFLHTGIGRLYIDRMSIANGRGPTVQPGPPDGGCILSAGTVELWRSRVHHCEVPAGGEESGWGSGLGGGIRAVNVVLNYSSVFSNKITGNAGTGGGIYGITVRMYYSQVYGNEGTDYGGGIAGGDVSAHYSLIHGNSAHDGGGIECSRLTLNKSTVSANRSKLFWYFGRWMENQAGGVYVRGTGRNLIVDSTISGNVAFNYSAANFGNGETLVYNSTITDNLENYPEGYEEAPWYPPEYFGRGALRAGTLRLQSSIVAGNRRTEGTPAYDLAPDTTVSGSRNLISHSQVAMPEGTLVVDDRRLAPLAENGGPTRTHLPLADSPVIDRGSNPLNREFDQRGAGFPRIKGAATDIGSVER